MHIPLHVRYLQHCSHKSYFFQQNAVVQVKNAELNEAKHELQSEVKTLQSEVGVVQNNQSGIFILWIKIDLCYIFFAFLIIVVSIWC